MIGTVVLDDGTPLRIIRAHLARGLVQVVVHWHDAMLTADHYRVLGCDGSHIWDALFRMNDRNACRGADVVLSIAFAEVMHDSDR